MIWLTWRQHRAQMLATIGLLVALGAVLLVSAIEATQWAADNAPDGCPGLDPICRSFNRGMYERYDLVYQVVGFLPLIGPALIGAFWGAPLVAREIERGTFRLAWTQSVPTKRWVAVKLGMLSVVVVLAGAALSTMVTSWNRLFHGAFPDTSLSNPGKFNVVGLAPAAWWLFAFAVGAAASALIRRTIPAMAVTVAVIAVALPAIIISQDFYAAPAEVIGADRDTLMNNGDMIVAEKWVGPDGRDMTAPTETICPPSGGTDMAGDRAAIAEQDCLAAKGYRMVFDVQPANRFWLFQGIQALILVVAAGFGLALAAWGTLRRRT